MCPYEFVIILGRIATDSSPPVDFRLFGALILLMALEELRFSDAGEVADISRT